MRNLSRYTNFATFVSVSEYEENILRGKEAIKKGHTEICLPLRMGTDMNKTPSASSPPFLYLLVSDNLASARRT